MAHDVFISHSSKDRVVANAVCAALEAEKIRCWTAPRDIKPGQSWAEAITKAIEKSSVMVLIFSSNSNNATNVLKELTLAVDFGVFVIPLRIEYIEPKGAMKFFLSDLHWLDAINPLTEKQIRELVERIKPIIETSSPEKPPKAPLVIKPEKKEDKKEPVKLKVSRWRSLTKKQRQIVQIGIIISPIIIAISIFLIINFMIGIGVPNVETPEKNELVKKVEEAITEEEAPAEEEEVATAEEETLGIYDDFNDITYEQMINQSLWQYNSQDGYHVLQQNGVLVIASTSEAHGALNINVSGGELGTTTIDNLGVMEAQIRLSSDYIRAGNPNPIQTIQFNTGGWFIECGLNTSSGDVNAWAHAMRGDNDNENMVDELNVTTPAESDRWYTFRIATDPETMTFCCYVDGTLIGSVVPSRAEALKSATFERKLAISYYQGEVAIAYVDNIRIYPGGAETGALAAVQPVLVPDDPTLYDSFDDPAYDGQINTELWLVEAEDPRCSIIQEYGKLAIRQGADPNHNSRIIPIPYYNFYLDIPMFFEAYVMMDAPQPDNSVFILLRNPAEDYNAFEEIVCSLYSGSKSTGYLNCWDRWNESPKFYDEYNAPIALDVDYGTWHRIRVELDPVTMTITYYLDNQKAGSHIPARAEELRNSPFMMCLHTFAGPWATGYMTGYIDNVRIGTFIPH